MTWLVAPSAVGIASAIGDADWAPCPPRYSDDVVRSTTGGENGDPLDDVPATLAQFRVYREMGLAQLPPELRLRRDVIARLLRAQSLLPAGVTFTILDGWRTREFQGELARYYREISASVVEDLYVWDPADTQVAPPHTTGGAVDLTITYDGRPLGLGTDYDSFDPRAHLDHFEHLDDGALSAADLLAKRLRRCMSNALTECGFGHFPNEWWHWSYGDQWWAARYGRAESLYSEIS